MRAGALILVLVLACVAFAWGSDGAGTAGEPGRHGPARFGAFDVVVEAPGALAAWQVSLRAEGVQIVGIEGGEHAAFAEAPHYDPRAMMDDRAILAAYSTAADLPTGATRIARVHVRLMGDAEPDWDAFLETAVGRDGTALGARVRVMRAEGALP